MISGRGLLINILNIDSINYLHKIENKNSIIGNLELSNIKLNKNIKELKNSKHRIIMITGDSANTAADVGKRLTLISSEKSTLVLFSF